MMLSRIDSTSPLLKQIYLIFPLIRHTCMHAVQAIHPLDQSVYSVSVTNNIKRDS